MRSGVERFIDEVSALGLCPRVEAELVICRFTPVAGARAGQLVDVGVAVEELGPWPQTPPYWVHLPGDIALPVRQIRPSSREGWLKHSRQISAWGSAPPAVDWSSHIQAVLKDATS